MQPTTSTTSPAAQPAAMAQVQDQDAVNYLAQQASRSIFASQEKRQAATILKPVHNETAQLQIQYLSAARAIQRAESTTSGPNFDTEANFRKYLETIEGSATQLDPRIQVPALDSTSASAKKLIEEAFCRYAATEGGVTEEKIQEVAHWSEIDPDALRTAYANDKNCQKIVRKKISALAVQIQGSERGFFHAREVKTRKADEVAARLVDVAIQIHKLESHRTEALAIIEQASQKLQEITRLDEEDATDATLEQQSKMQNEVEALLGKLAKQIPFVLRQKQMKREREEKREDFKAAALFSNVRKEVPMPQTEALRHQVVQLKTPFETAGISMGAEGVREVDFSTAKPILRSTKSRLETLQQLIHTHDKTSVDTILDEELPEYGLTRQHFYSAIMAGYRAQRGTKTKTGESIFTKYINNEYTGEALTKAKAVIDHAISLLITK